MSRKNKVNPDHYKVAGRLSADDLARERMKQSAPQTARAWDERPGQLTWMDGRSAGPGPGNDAEAAGPSATRRPTGVKRVAKSGAKAQAKKPATGTRKTPVSRRSAAAKPARNAATRKNKRASVGRRKTARKTPARR
jgi:hypothetical protein